MAIRPIRVYPDPILRMKAKAVLRFTSFHERVMRDLSDTLKIQPGGIGIAAPQIGYSVQIAIVDLERKDPSKKRLILINPVLVSAKGEKMGREGCMSIPDFTANIKRAEKIRVRTKNERFEDCEIEADGLEAVCIQHEMDHLIGFLFLDRVQSLARDVFRRKIYLH